MLSTLQRVYRLLAVFVVLTSTEAWAQSHAEILQRHGPMENAENRRNAVAEMARLEADRKVRAERGAAVRRWPKRRVLPNGTVQELVEITPNGPVYFTTHNTNAAIVSGANLLRTAPYNVTGDPFIVGKWDGGSARISHQEFGGRVIAKDGAAADNHATHVAGTIAASGVQSMARGMAPGVRIDSYDFNGDKSEMTSRGASYPGEPGTIYLSNHSYGYVSGWNRTGLASPAWEWWGSGTTASGVEDDFGKYNTYARDADSMAASLPYYLIFRSAGNERTDNPTVGSAVTLSPNGTTVLTYDVALHPAGDGMYRGSGYDTIGFDAVAKNVITIGSASDAISGGIRAPALAAVSPFSSWGPTDDGRIKPDLVANGDSVYSTFNSSNSAYGYLSGTSMSTPSATGSAVMVLHVFDQLFPGHAMRASTLKALLLHTADDLGTPGPDYQSGWGLINVKAAADLVQAYRNAPGTRAIIEDRISTTRSIVTQSFTWDGASPIRATLAWTDPAGPATNSGDSRTARLVNNLQLQVIAPDGSTHSPYVMPFVGDWTAAKLSAAATKGVNNTDNVEQVFIAAPPVAGAYQVRVTFTGTLTNAVQPFSLVLSGGASNDVAPAPSVGAITPATANSGQTTFSLSGANILLGAAVKFSRSGSADVAATGLEVFGEGVKARLNTSGMPPGLWHVTVTNPDGQSATLPNAFAVVGSAWEDALETGAAGWTHSANIGADQWTLTTAQSHSPAHSFFSPGAAVRSDTSLYSPGIAVPLAATTLQLSFWHQYTFENGNDGGVLELSVDGGNTFVDVTASGSGASFASGGYASKISSSGQPATRNPLAGRNAWSGSSNGWKQAVVNLTDLTKFAGKTLKVRWRLGTNSSTASGGWYVDDVVLSGAMPGNLAPVVLAPASASSMVVTGTSVDLSVDAADDGGAEELTYTWSVNDEFDAPIQFSENGTALARNTTAVFSRAGRFTFTVTIRDTEGLTTTSSVDVQVDQAFTSLTLNPVEVVLEVGGSQQFAASARDQFAHPLGVQPVVEWGAAGGGSVAANGLFTAGLVPGGPFTISATTGAFTENAVITITGQSFLTWQNTHFNADELADGLSDEATDADGDGLRNLVEFALGTDPRVPSGGPVASLSADASGQTCLTLSYTRPTALPGIAYVAEVSSDLVHWNEVPEAEVTTDGATESIIVRDTAAAGEASNASEAPGRFLRLRVIRTAP